MAFEKRNVSADEFHRAKHTFLHYTSGRKALLSINLNASKTIVLWQTDTKAAFVICMREWEPAEPI
jgi:hypothetical protein